ncbi:MAG: hypothetical protein HUU22_09615 [Phycisphaerae bacterium]|nr:hypothetical protein [Phycisphaerae bacterium]
MALAVNNARMAPQLLSTLLLFSEPGFPVLDVDALVEIAGATEARTVDELIRELTPQRIFVWRHGSAFPAELWAPLQRFLENGGTLVYLGGAPFTRPVVGPPGARVVQPPTLSMIKALRLNQCERISVAGGRLRSAIGFGATSERVLPSPTWAWVLEPRLTEAKTFANEDGSDGPRDGAVRGLVHVLCAANGAAPSLHADMREFPCAAAAVAVYRLRGRWAGGKWVFWLLSTPPRADELNALLAEARRPVVDFRVAPTFGCFHEGERPSLLVRLYRPRGESPREHEISLSVTAPDGATHPQLPLKLRVAEHGSTRVPLDVPTAPGLYRVTAQCPPFPPATTGYWVFDAELFASGGALSFDDYTLRRNDRPAPVIGTTVMSAGVHRQFLFEPNAATWDDTFAELSAMGVDLVRTGAWTAYKKISLEPHQIDEAWLRALEAYYLSARKHGVAVVFTFFAFLPEPFGGENPYLDPRAVEGQRAYLSAVASRFANAREIMWDLINEPSFSSAEHLWHCRPNRDKHEEEAFLKWLEQRFGPPDRPPRTSTTASAPTQEWDGGVRARWRLTPDEPLGLPTKEDFADRHVFEKARPYRAADYVLFAQDAFATWIDQMSEAIRAAGSTAPITVGQDEGGLTQRPSPLFHHRRTSFTSMHTWWNNDALLWDGLMACGSGTPMLISETGVMQRELLSGAVQRDPEARAKLLSRKIGYAFAAGAFGVVQWCYDANPYMPVDNEAAIGLRRADGSYKPEHAVLRTFAAFVARNRERFEHPVPPQTVVIVPSADVFSPRDFGAPGTRRLVDVVCGDLNVPVRFVSEYRTSEDLGAPRAIILPSCRGIGDAAWRDICSAVRNGATLICSGWFECNDAGLPAERLKLAPRPLARFEPWAPREATPAAAGESSSHEPLRFPLSVVESWYAAAHDGPAAASLHAPAGGRVWHHPLPIDWGETLDAARSFYDAGLKLGGVEPDESHAGAPGAAGVLVRTIRFREARLIVAVNESSVDAALRLGDHPWRVPAGEARMAFADAATGRILDASHQ